MELMQCSAFALCAVYGVWRLDSWWLGYTMRRQAARQQRLRESREYEARWNCVVWKIRTKKMRAA